MKVRLLKDRASESFIQHAGEVVSVSEQDGKRMIELGRATPFIELQENVETACIDINRESKSPKRKRGGRKQ